MTRRRAMFLLDSGAYSAFTKGVKIDIEKYAEFVHKHHRLFRGGAFNLDVIGSDKASYENWLELRRLGVETIPVHHRGDDDLYLKKYLDATDYIAVGAMAKVPVGERTSVLDYLWKTYLLDGAGVPRCRVHGLGMTDVGTMVRYPWYSVDSTRLAMMVAFGSTLVPLMNGGGLPDYSNPSQLCVSDQRRNHHVGSANSYYSLPKIVKKSVGNFIRSLGFEVDETIEGRVLSPQKIERVSKDAIWSGGLGIVFDDSWKSSEVDFNNVTHAWQARYAVGVIVMDRCIRLWKSRGTMVRLYHVPYGYNISTVLNSTPIESVSRCLLSYHGMTEKILNQVRGVLYGDQEGEAGRGDSPSGASRRAERTISTGDAAGDPRGPRRRVQ